MFPLNFNSLFRKSNGELTTLGKMYMQLKELTEDIIPFVGDYIPTYNTAGGTSYNVTITTDGIKDMKTLMKELADALVTKCQALPTGQYIHVRSAMLTDGEWFIPLKTELRVSNNTTTLSLGLRGLSASNSTAKIKSVTIHTTLSNNNYYQWSFNTSGNTYTDMKDTIPTSGQTFYIYYEIMKKM